MNAIAAAYLRKCRNCVFLGLIALLLFFAFSGAAYAVWLDLTKRAFFILPALLGGLSLAAAFREFNEALRYERRANLLQ